MNILYIDTTDNQEISVGLFINSKKNILKEKMQFQKAQAVLPMIEKILQKNDVTLKDVDEIEVNPGPGSFTGTRVGVSIANALGFALHIPVNRMTIVEPKYKDGSLKFL